MSNAPLWSRLRRQKTIFRSNLPSHQGMRRIGAPASPGSQTIRLVFDQPQRLKCISLVFEENETSRTQEFVLRWSPDGGNSVREIVRQQWNFSPPESIHEVEEFQVALSSVTVLELLIKPDISGGVARASLKNLRLSDLVHCCSSYFRIDLERIFRILWRERRDSNPRPPA